MQLRQPVVVVLGHVDSGKTSLLDRIRGTAVQAREAGGITQHIGASFFPIETIKDITGPLYQKLSKSESQIPGLLVIDTPGHEVFANLRVRGGSAADIAILVVDANKGFEAQTIESMEILRKRKVPFVIALNKVDMISGWRKNSNNVHFISDQLAKQDIGIQEMLDEKIYNVVGSLSRSGYNSEAYWRVKDFTKEVAIVPVSAATGVGIPELLAVLVGMTQQYMVKKLERHNGSTRGIVLEINEEVGLGPSANIILLDGILRHGDNIVVAKRDSAIVTKIKALLLPKPLDEMRDPRDKFKPVNEVISAAGLKITSPDLNGVLAGSPLYVLETKEDEDRLKPIVESEIKSAIINNTDSNGVILRCDTIGSIEAIMDLLKKANVPVQSADIGQITRRDVIAASAVKEKDRYLGVILGFNARVLDDAQKESQERGVKIFNEQIIYNLVRTYTDWVTYQREHEESILFNEIPPVCKFQFMKGFIFRRNDPAVFGAEILVGKLRQKVLVINEEGRKIGVIHQVQENGKAIEEASKGMQVAVSIKEPVIGRQINEGDIFYTDMNSKQAKMLIERFNHRLNEEEKEVFNRILFLKRKSDSAYGYF
ncbi:MAG TPA: translation initiation factor IF-2 [Nitrososphaeraceae archaeon]|nr:translation initiation factor IF-2 [Nitrososphaeraceae archaeon]